LNSEVEKITQSEWVLSRLILGMLYVAGILLTIESLDSMQRYGITQISAIHLGLGAFTLAIFVWISLRLVTKEKIHLHRKVTEQGNEPCFFLKTPPESDKIPL